MKSNAPLTLYCGKKIAPIMTSVVPDELSQVSSDVPYYEIKPESALNWDYNETISRVSGLIGKQKVYDILNGKEIQSPNSCKKDGSWLENSKIIGINPRALGSYFDIVKYAMTFPEDSIHILPVFETGCQGSLYAPVNFKLSDEFMDDELVKMGFDTPEKQLKLTINLLHGLGKNVGMDFLQHTDRFSEEVFINPDNFIWAKLDETSSKELEYPEIHPDTTGNEVKKAVINYLKNNGNSYGKQLGQNFLDNFYSTDENIRREILFGNKENRLQRRLELMNAVRNAHLETKPLSIDDPCTKITFKEMKSSNGVSWAEFSDNKNNNIFGNLTSYKLYHLDEYGNPDISKPNKAAWDFIENKTAKFQKEYGFDFLRADMGYLSFHDEKKDIHASVKDKIQKNGSKHFATFGECFCGFSYSDENAIKRKNYNAVLGNLQYKNVYDNDFVNTVKINNFNPNFKIANTSITADSDQACYNRYYDNFQNTIRTFMGLFLNQPSYMGMGLETRDRDVAEGKFLTKDFINDWGIKKYEWGKNDEFFRILSSMRYAYSKIKDVVSNQLHYWLNTNDENIASWFYYSKKDNMPSFLFVSNTSNENKPEVEIQSLFDTNVSEKLNEKCNTIGLNEIYSTKPKKMNCYITSKGQKMKIKNLAPGECRIYKVVNTLNFNN